MIMAAADLLGRDADPTDAEIRHAIEGNICRCTGYHNIVVAVREAARRRCATGAGRARRDGAEEASTMATDVLGTPRQAGGGPAGSSPARAATSTTSSCPGMVHMAILRSPYAHANIRSIDTSAAEARARRARGLSPARTSRTTRCPWPGRPAAPAGIQNNVNTPRVLATDRVKWTGEGVAAVVAETPGAGRRTRSS